MAGEVCPRIIAINAHDELADLIIVACVGAANAPLSWTGLNTVPGGNAALALLVTTVTCSVAQPPPNSPPAIEASPAVHRRSGHRWGFQRQIGRGGGCDRHHREDSKTVGQRMTILLMADDERTECALLVSSTPRTVNYIERRLAKLYPCGNTSPFYSGKFQLSSRKGVKWVSAGPSRRSDRRTSQPGKTAPRLSPPTAGDFTQSIYECAS